MSNDKETGSCIQQAQWDTHVQCYDNTVSYTCMVYYSGLLVSGLLACILVP